MYSFTNLSSRQTVEDCDETLGYIAGMDLKQRIYQARKDAKLTQQELADGTGKTRSAVAQWESGEVRPRHKTLTLIANATGKDLRWLESGVDAKKTGLWVVGEIAAGAWKEAAAMLEPYPVPVAADPKYPAEAQRLYRVSGNSINQHVQHGDFVHCVGIIAADLHPISGDLVVVRRLDGERAEYTVKRYIRSDNREILRPESTDPQFQDDLVIDGDDAVEIEITDIVIAKWSPIARGSL